MTVLLLPGYSLRRGSTLDRSLLVKFMQRTYAEIAPENGGSHLPETVEQYFSGETPVWWVEAESAGKPGFPSLSAASRRGIAVACLWLGTAVNPASGDRHAHIFLLYVAPDHRRQGLASALLNCAEAWATERGDRQIGLQAFLSNQPALELYQNSGYKPQSIWMVKDLNANS